MDRIDFYILANADTRGCERFTCRLVEKAYDQGHRVYIRTRDREQAERLDALLWQFREESFLPHALTEQAQGEPIVLGAEDDPASERDVLVNLTGGLPSDWSAYRRLAEVVDPAGLSAARQRYRQYQKAGLQPRYHKLDT